MKAFIKIVIGFIVSLFRKEYQLKDILEQGIKDIAERRGCTVSVNFKLMSGTKQEYLMTVRVNINSRITSYTSAVFNEVSTSYEDLSGYLDQFFQIFNSHIEEVQSHAR